MKKLLVLGLLSLAGISASARDAAAWYLGCCRDRCCNKCTTTLCMRPYNAFSPVAYGNITADGCMPLNIYGGQLPPMQMPSCFAGGHCGPQGCGPQGCCPPSCFTSGCCDAGCLPAPGGMPAPGAMMPGPQMPIQMMPGQPQGGPQFTPPAPQMLNQSMYMMPGRMPYGYGQVQPVGYYPGYQPMYNPYAYPVAPVGYYGGMQAPGYWYGR